MKNGTKKEYYLGLDIGTDSVGYAVTDPAYNLIKYKGEPMWGVMLFEGANTAAERRSFRTARRRLNRRQQRVQLLNELFAEELCKVDPKFFVRLAASRLFREDAGEPHTLFNDKDYTDIDYYKQYPTIHHLITDLMYSSEPHDIRLVYLACAWLVAHRGHFLFDTPVEEVSELLDFNKVYSAFLEWMDANGYALPWSRDVSGDQISAVLCRKLGATRKFEAFKAEILNGKKPEKKIMEGTPFAQEAVIKLLSGSKVKPVDLFGNESYKEIKSVALGDDDETFADILAELGDDAELLIKLRALNDCAMLVSAQGGKPTISEAKVAVYEQHHEDLTFLKYFIKKYLPDSYSAVFLDAAKGQANYVAYSANTRKVKSKAVKDAELKKVTKEAFCDYVAKLLKSVKEETIDEEDRAAFKDTNDRLKAYSFMPKQKNSDNRVIPYQLYYHELDLILKNAATYLPFLAAAEEKGITRSDKIRSIFTFRIPYFVGPLNSYRSKNAWMIRKHEGKIYPWNFEEMVDLDKSESEFIRRMTNSCTYLPGEPVLPKYSLLYCEFTILNEINNVKIDGVAIPEKAKQGIFEELFKRKARVTVKDIKDYLMANNYMRKDSELTGLDTTVKSSYKPYISFRRLLESKQLSIADVERIIEQMAYTEDRKRLKNWLKHNYAHLSEEDIKYVANLPFKEFGRLSRRFLTEFLGADTQTGEAFTIMEAMRVRSENLMQLLSLRYTFTEQLDEFTQDYYAKEKKTLDDRMRDMWVSNSVKRPILRAMDIISDVEKAMKAKPRKVFVEMARGGTEDQKGKRTKSRKEQILELYKTAEADTRVLMAELEAMGADADFRLQSDKLFLYYMQFGRCMYTDESIQLSQLGNSDLYDIDHIYPQSIVKDDSILNNKVLVTSKANGAKGNNYPISAKIRASMHGRWKQLKDLGMMSDEKFHRLTRATRFTEDEKWGFINRQLVETRQSTKVVTQLLKERYGDEVEIVYVKAGLVSDFRHEFEMLKCRSVNDLHHAKDAFLNIVVGNVYNMKFSRKFFNLDSNYTVKTKAIFTHVVKCGGMQIWAGQDDLARIKKTMAKNNIHLVRYTFCRKGGFFDQMPLKADEGLVPLKKGMPTEKYGGYNKPTASFYLLASYEIGKKSDIMFVPVELMVADRVKSDRAFALEYVAQTISEINSGKSVSNVKILLNGRIIKINTVISMDGMRVTLSGKASRGKQLIVKTHSPLVLGLEQERYVKRLERFIEKRSVDGKSEVNEKFDKITCDQNEKLYDLILSRATDSIFRLCPGNFSDTMLDRRKAFSDNTIENQVVLLTNIIAWFGAIGAGCDLSLIQGGKSAGAKVPSSKLQNWKRIYRDVRIVDMSPAGLVESYSENLIDLL